MLVGMVDNGRDVVWVALKASSTLGAKELRQHFRVRSLDKVGKAPSLSFPAISKAATDLAAFEQPSSHYAKTLYPDIGVRADFLTHLAISLVSFQSLDGGKQRLEAGQSTVSVGQERRIPHGVPPLRTLRSLVSQQ
jgi:hypothetical protein